MGNFFFIQSVALVEIPIGPPGPRGPLEVQKVLCTSALFSGAFLSQKGSALPPTPVSSQGRGNVDFLPKGGPGCSSSAWLGLGVGPALSRVASLARNPPLPVSICRQNGVAIVMSRMSLLPVYVCGWGFPPGQPLPMAGDQIVVTFNAHVSCSDPPGSATAAAIAQRLASICPLKVFKWVGSIVPSWHGRLPPRLSVFVFILGFFLSSVCICIFGVICPSIV